MLKKNVKWTWVMVISLVFILFISQVLPRVSAYTTKTIGDLASPDTSFFYTAKDLYTMAKTYGESGRKAYVWLRWTFDVVWPFIYTSFLLIWTMKLTSYVKGKKGLNSLFLLPTMAMILDFLENIGATIVMGRYPSTSGIIAHITPMVTFFKWITLSASFGWIMVLIFILIVQKVRKIM